MNKLNTILFVLLTLSLVLISGGCAKKEVDNESDSASSGLTIDQAIEKLNKAGFEVARGENVKAPVFAADDGAIVTIEGAIVELYSFKVSGEKVKANAKDAFERTKARVLELGDILVVIYSSDAELISKIEDALN